MPARPTHAPVLARLRVFPVTEPASGPYGITPGPDGALWCTLVHTGRIARLTPAGDLTEFPLDSLRLRPLRDHAGSRRRPVVHAHA
ncbi:hydrolase [Streptomyces mobaraensis NBRC 13819 = DSM 40847]|uniref:Hydrolase n=1 Tax=Streptomyces mobaraensis (strain ATCC 29032 / DSM 40847 / JCM 4168 / NBRC 13819 / NCIMB 11159 / IPCR 16-22) TaxID=1223523 RepID=M3C118_STRM1|nr:hydrolase [Streptomyces mobaraensis NBRC 13819 = DSM 40847]